MMSSPTWLNWILFGVFVFKAQCSISGSDRKSPDIYVSSDRTSTTVESMESFKLIENENSYESLMARLNLRPLCWRRSARIDYKAPAESKIFAEIVFYNFVEGHFYGYNNVLNRSSGTDKLPKDKRFNAKILYHLMQDEEAIQLIGFDTCLLLIHDIIRRFEPYAPNAADEHSIKNLFHSVGSDLVDFLEFILNNLAPKYSFNRSDKFYNFEAHCELEYVGMLEAESFIKFALVDLFKETDFIKVLVRRYKVIWPASLTRSIIHDAARISKDNEGFHMYRDIFTFLVRIVPENFVHPNEITKYNNDIRVYKRSFYAIMELMAPLLRVLMLVDSEAVIDQILENYYSRVSNGTDPAFNCSDNSLKVLDIFIRDSKFSLIKNQIMKERKANLLEKIFEKFYKLNRGNIYSILRYALSHEYFPLYEVLLQHFGHILTLQQWKELLNMIMTNVQSKKYIIPIVITMGYFDYEDFDQILHELDPTKKSLPPLMSKGAIVKNQIERFNVIKDVYVMISTCPILHKVDIFVDSWFQSVPWPYPNEIIEHDNDKISKKQEIIPKLFYYAQAVLAKRFNIPVYGISVFESTMDELATWSETIGYMNLMIDTKAKLVFGAEDATLFKFIDATVYDL